MLSRSSLPISVSETLILFAATSTTVESEKYPIHGGWPPLWIQKVHGLPDAFREN